MPVKNHKLASCCGFDWHRSLFKTKQKISAFIGYFANVDTFSILTSSKWKQKYQICSALLLIAHVSSVTCTRISKWIIYNEMKPNIRHTHIQLKRATLELVSTNLSIAKYLKRQQFTTFLVWEIYVSFRYFHIKKALLIDYHIDFDQISRAFKFPAVCKNKTRLQ